MIYMVDSEKKNDLHGMAVRVEDALDYGGRVYIPEVIGFYEGLMV